MAKSKIEWCDYTINPVKGLCPMACSYCYARRMYKRFKWNTEIRLDQEAFVGIDSLPKGSRIFVGSTMELFGDWVKEDWLSEIFNFISEYWQHTFIFLTKQPQNLAKWSPLPDNCWVGTSVTHEGYGADNHGCAGSITSLEDIDAKVKFVSFEPLLSGIQPSFIEFVNWVIIGQQTPVSKKTQPKIEWIQEIVKAADKAKVPVFLKNNLRCRELLSQSWAWGNDKLRQEFSK